ncbi:hypothetical protein RGQ29_027398 [Quercus rubra]|uniref:O-fucosyltransferase family protein n=1 Tax=Quercus rubra TaxID=3512 RepID=A0AAN7EQT3_QUERU|nr:hypothetical protein RGQ29_027398 [Quercus rubra]
MAKSKCSNNRKVSYISVPSQIINSLSATSLQSLLLSPKKSSKQHLRFFSYKSPRLWCFLLFLFGFIGMLKLGYNLDPVIPFHPYPCATNEATDLNSNGYSKPFKVEILNSINESQPLISNGSAKSEVGIDADSESEFWKQPDGLGYKPCLVFSRDYRRASEGLVKDRSKYLMVVVSGGMNQQRNQIVDAVVIARILGAALVVPILLVNIIWGDESEFSDIFDLEHFKRVLADDVRIVSALPSTHLMTKPVESSPLPHATPQWIRGHYLRRIEIVQLEGVLLLRSLDSRLTKDLPSDLQKLKCKVAFHALRFAPPILEVRNKLAERTLPCSSFKDGERCMG